MRIVEIDEVNSTNNWVSDNRRQLSSPTLVRAIRQSAGRGQRGNSWESSPGQNLTVSLYYKPQDFAAAGQFLLSEGVALAVCDTLRGYGIEAKVKWPNDVYVGDKKICGILIEHSVAGRNILETVAGIGLNVNQSLFVSDAPNPVSMRQLTQKEYDPGEVCSQLADNLEKRLNIADTAGLHAEYMSTLWRGDGRFYPFATPDGNRFSAMIIGVAPDGMLTLVDIDCRQRTFAFKEVSFLL